MLYMHSLKVEQIQLEIFPQPEPEQGYVLA